MSRTLARRRAKRLIRKRLHGRKSMFCHLPVYVVRPGEPAPAGALQPQALLIRLTEE